MPNLGRVVPAHGAYGGALLLFLRGNECGHQRHVGALHYLGTSAKTRADYFGADVVYVGREHHCRRLAIPGDDDGERQLECGHGGRSVLRRGRAFVGRSAVDAGRGGFRQHFLRWEPQYRERRHRVTGSIVRGARWNLLCGADAGVRVALVPDTRHRDREPTYRPAKLNRLRQELRRVSNDEGPAVSPDVGLSPPSGLDGGACVFRRPTWICHHSRARLRHDITGSAGFISSHHRWNTHLR